MPTIFILYVKVIDKITDFIGRITMYTIFVMMAILVLSFVTRNIINFPLLWIIEMAQFIMTGYYLMGGAYSMKENQHVRMDLVYGNLSEKNKAKAVETKPVNIDNNIDLYIPGIFIDI